MSRLIRNSGEFFYIGIQEFLMKYWYSRWNTGILDDILVFPLKAENLFRKAAAGIFCARSVLPLVERKDAEGDE